MYVYADLFLHRTWSVCICHFDVWFAEPHPTLIIGVNHDFTFLLGYVSITRAALWLQDTQDTKQTIGTENVKGPWYTLRDRIPWRGAYLSQWWHNVPRFLLPMMSKSSFILFSLWLFSFSMLVTEKPCSLIRYKISFWWTIPTFFPNSPRLEKSLRQTL